jgi:NAD(P)-dependent dehydrogenase (short-subunit alcohol dehydrogenase family)
MKNKIVLITGANSGMGKATTTELAKKGAHVVMICRNPALADVAKKEIITASDNKNIDVLICDLSLQSSIYKLAGQIKDNYACVDVLINNAGLALSKYTETPEGIETTFATNVLSMFLLTNLLADHLKKANASRVVTVASSTHTSAKLQPGDIGHKANYSLFGTYNQSKLCNIMLTYEFARRFGSSVSVNCLNPGPVKTELARDMSGAFKFMAKLMFPSAQKASRTAIYLASSNEIDNVTGKYFSKRKPIESSKLSKDVNAAQQLWDLCNTLTKNNFQ